MAAAGARSDTRRVAIAVALLLALIAAVVTSSLFFWPTDDAPHDDPLRPRSLFSASAIAPGEVRTFAFTEDGVTEIAEGSVDDALFRVHVVRLEGGELRAFDARSTSPVRPCSTSWREVSVAAHGRGFYFNDPCLGATFTIDGAAVFGPAPRGLDRVHLEVRDGMVVVDPSRITPGARWAQSPAPTPAADAAGEEPSVGY